MWLQVIVASSVLFCSFFTQLCGSEPSHAPSEMAKDKGPSASQNQVWEELCANHQVKQWYMDALQNPDLLVSDEHLTYLPLLSLAEWKCSGRFDRKASDIRTRVEEAICRDLDSLLSSKQALSEPVRMLSLGGIGMLQDWFIIGRLIKKGVTNIDLTVVDRHLLPEAVHGMESLSEALKAEGVNLSLTFLSSFQAGKKQTPYHIVYSIASVGLSACMKDEWTTLLNTRKLLAPNAHLFVAYGTEFIRFDGQGSFEILGSDPHVQDVRKCVVNDLTSEVRRKDKTIKVAVTSSDWTIFPSTLLYAVNDLVQKGYEDIVIQVCLKSDKIAMTDLSALFSEVSKKKASLIWKNHYYIRNAQADRLDMYVMNLPGLEIDNVKTFMSHEAALSGMVLGEQGHCVVYADQLGLWDVKGSGTMQLVKAPQGDPKKAYKLMDEIFSSGLKIIPKDF